MTKVGQRWRARRGYTARVICNDMNDPEYPIVALIQKDSTTPERPILLTAEGKFHADGTRNGNDLVELLDDVKQPDIPSQVAWTNEECLFLLKHGFHLSGGRFQHQMIKKSITFRLTKEEGRYDL